jgi:hypothetical protein
MDDESKVGHGEQERRTWSVKSTGSELCRGRVHLGIFIHLYFPKKRTSAT